MSRLKPQIVGHSFLGYFIRTNAKANHLFYFLQPMLTTLHTTYFDKSKILHDKNSPRRIRFYPVSVHVGFMVVEMTAGHAFLRVLVFSFLYRSLYAPRSYFIICHLHFTVLAIDSHFKRNASLSPSESQPKLHPLTC